MSASYIIDPIVYQQLAELKTTKSRYHFNFYHLEYVLAAKMQKIRVKTDLTHLNTLNTLPPWYAHVCKWYET